MVVWGGVTEGGEAGSGFRAPRFRCLLGCRFVLFFSTALYISALFISPTQPANQASFPPETTPQAHNPTLPGCSPPHQFARQLLQLAG